jgi:threonine/homoserine/homoserine lactone efflux protein
MAVSFIIFSAIALLAGTISKYMKRHHHVGLFFKWLQIIVFIGIAVFILL